MTCSSPELGPALITPAPKAVPFWEAFLFWLKLGFVSFGGPAGQIALMHKELVERKRWISNSRFLHALNYCMLLPGPEAQQLATYIGWLLHRTGGGVVAGVLFVLPSLIILILLSWLYIAYGELPLIAGAFYGIKPAVTAIVVYSAYRIGTRVLHNHTMRLLALASFIALTILAVPFPLIIIGAALIGLVVNRYFPAVFGKTSEHGPTGLKDEGSFALINDNSTLVPHTQITVKRALRVLIAGAALWLIPFVVLRLSFEEHHLLLQMAVFFTETALLTFGGAYAVLPYVFHRAVHDFSWLSTQQMIDGLALGETTPGPLIMIVAYVGFVGGYLRDALGGDSRIIGGIAAACVATWYTFLPSFIFILGGAPFIESTRNTPSFAPPLSAISAAVVGVILHLALLFGGYVFIRSLSPLSVDWMAVTLAVLAYIGLVRFKLSTAVVIVGNAILGSVLTLA